MINKQIASQLLLSARFQFLSLEKHEVKKNNGLDYKFANEYCSSKSHSHTPQCPNGILSFLKYQSINCFHGKTPQLTFMGNNPISLQLIYSAVVLRKWAQQGAKLILSNDATVLEVLQHIDNADDVQAMVFPSRICVARTERLNVVLE